MRVVVLAIVLTLTAAAVAPTAAASSETSAVTYRAPADAAVVDGFRPPPKPWMAGNLGIDLGTAPGDIVRAPADGRVLFAGQVAGALHVTIEHADGLRTTCSFLATVSVSAGERVRLGDPIGTTDGPMHFGVRTPDDTYLDPAALLDGSLHPTSLLIPGADEGIEALGAHERRTLLRTLLDDAALVQQARVNSATQFTESPDFEHAFIGAAADNQGANQKMTEYIFSSAPGRSALFADFAKLFYEWVRANTE